MYRAPPKAGVFHHKRIAEAIRLDGGTRTSTDFAVIIQITVYHFLAYFVKSSGGSAFFILSD